MNDNRKKLEDNWEIFKKMRMPPAMADLKEELTLIDTQIAGLVSTYLSSGSLLLEDIKVNDHVFNKKLNEYQTNDAHEEEILNEYKEYKYELDNLLDLLIICLSNNSSKVLE
jgi:argininosuccinate synthase